MIILHKGKHSEFDECCHLQSMAMPTGLSGSPDLSVHSKSTSPVLKSSSPQSLLPAAITSTSSDVSVAPGSEVRRRSLQQPPGRVWQPVSRNSSVYGTPGQTNRQSFVQRKYFIYIKKVIQIKYKNSDSDYFCVLQMYDSSHTTLQTCVWSCNSHA
jgi:hypothetical protein